MSTPTFDYVIGKIDIITIEAVDVNTFSEECTQEVREAIPLCAKMVLQELNSE